MTPLWRALARLRRLPRSESGQGLVEMALVAPILLLLILGTVDMARAWNKYQVITDAAREGARNAVIDDPLITPDSVRNVVSNALARAGIDTTGATTTIAVAGTCCVNGGRGDPVWVDVTVSHTFGWIAPFLGWVPGVLGDGTINLQTSITMRHE